MDTVIWVIIALAVLAGFAWVAKWIIENFLPEPVRTPALMVVGVILLILLIIGVARIFGLGNVSLVPPRG